MRLDTRSPIVALNLYSNTQENHYSGHHVRFLSAKAVETVLHSRSAARGRPRGPRSNNVGGAALSWPVYP